MEFEFTIKNKSEIEFENGLKLVDLTEQLYNPKDSDGEIINIIISSEDTVMRPDLIAKMAYGNESHTEKLLKTSGYSNPFSIDKDDIFIIRELSEVSAQFESGKIEKKRDDIRSQFIDVSKKSKTDTNLKEYNSRKSRAESLPPNLSSSGDKEVKLEGGKVIYGDDVSRNKNKSKSLSEKAKHLSKLIK